MSVKAINGMLCGSKNVFILIQSGGYVTAAALTTVEPISIKSS